MDKTADKSHYVSAEQANKALSEDGFVLTTKIQSACGRPAYQFSLRWEFVECKDCLRRRPKSQLSFDAVEVKSEKS